MKPGDLVQFIEPEINGTDIMIVLQINPGYKDDGWSFCTAGRETPESIDVFYPTKGIQTYKSWALRVISDNHATAEHAKLTALAFAGACSTRKQGDCQ